MKHELVEEFKTYTYQDLIEIVNNEQHIPLSKIFKNQKGYPRYYYKINISDNKSIKIYKQDSSDSDIECIILIVFEYDIVRISKIRNGLYISRRKMEFKLTDPVLNRSSWTYYFGNSNTAYSYNYALCRLIQKYK